MKTPGEDSPAWKMENEEEYLNTNEVKTYRMIAARANYLAADRTDIQLSTKECCRGMSKPQVGHWNGLKRLARSDGLEVPLAISRGVGGVYGLRLG